MKTDMIIEVYYRKAVEGLTENILDDQDIWYSYVINLPDELQITYTVDIFQQQVLNGGFHQYFFNSYGQFAYLTIEHLLSIQAIKSASILQRAVDEVNSERLSLNNFRKKIFNRELDRIVDFDEDLIDYLEKLDDEYDNTEEDLEQLIIDYFKLR